MSLIDDFIESSRAHRNVEESSQGRSEPDDLNTRLKTDYVPAFYDTTDSIFSLHYVQFELPSSLIDLKVENNILYVAISSALLRIDLDSPLDVIQVPIPVAKDDVIAKMYLDPTGNHVLVSTQRGENYYVQNNKAKRMGKLNGINITAVRWISSSMATGVPRILFGTRDGVIYETWLDIADASELLFLFSSEQPSCITGLYSGLLPGTRGHIALVTTASRLYQFLDRRQIRSEGVLRELFQRDPEIQELPNDVKERQNFHFSANAKLFTWLTGVGVYYGSTDFQQQTAASIIDRIHLLPLPSTFRGEAWTPQPISVAITQFHIIFLYPDRISVMSHLNEKIVYEEKIPLQRNEVVQGLAVDDSRHTYWVSTTSAIYELVAKEEDKNVWRIYLDKKKYGEALSYCKDIQQKDSVYSQQAQDYFDQGKYKRSAECYALSSTHFEHVILQFMKKRAKNAIQVYLAQKLGRTSPELRTQRSIMAMWLAELYLAKLNYTHDKTLASSWTLASQRQKQPVDLYRNEKKILEREFDQFLVTYSSCLHAATMYKFLEGYGDKQFILRFAEIIGDHQKIIELRVQEGSWEEALCLIDNMNDTGLLYKYSPVLMETIPVKVVDMWMTKPFLNPQLLIPSLLRYNHAKQTYPTEQNQAIRYLSHVVTALYNRDTTIHNLLVTLYASQPTQDETALLTFLNNEGRDMHYDVDYALRVCNQYGRHQSCVHLYSAMGLYEEAVDLAIKCDDIELARIHADKPLDDNVLRKQLWLKIAKYAFEEKKMVKEAIELLKPCELLKIEDLLPFFPDFVLIDDFKDEICAALEEYNIFIEDLKADMDDATESADKIRLDMRTLKTKSADIDVADHCCVCRYPLLARQFYAFPCGHVYHADCLISKTTKYLPTPQIRKLANLQERISHNLTAAATLQTPTSRMYHPSSTDTESPEDKQRVRTEQLKEEVDDIVARECTLCGDVMISSIGLPFISEEEAGLQSSWTI